MVAEVMVMVAEAGLAASAAVKPTRIKRKAGKAKKTAAAIKFRDEKGNGWVGLGKRPQWLRDQLNAGKTLADFLVK